MAAVTKITSGGVLRLELIGFDEVTHNLRLTKDQHANLQKFVKDEAYKLMDIAKRTVPVATGRLRDSHRVESDGADKNLIEASVVAGGLNIRGKFVDYAAAVHEGVKVRSGWPWLENSLRFLAPGFYQRLKSAVKIYGRGA